MKTQLQDSEFQHFNKCFEVCTVTWTQTCPIPWRFYCYDRGFSAKLHLLICSLCVLLQKRISFNVLWTRESPTFCVTEEENINTGFVFFVFFIEINTHTSSHTRGFPPHSGLQGEGGQWRRKMNGYKYVEWKLCEANASCALFIRYCRRQTKKVVLLCTHTFFFF